jgi:hypothetical protein
VGEQVPAVRADFDNGTKLQTLIEHWTAPRWKRVPSPSPGSVSNDRHGVTAISASNIWAVGYYLDGTAISLWACTAAGRLSAAHPRQRGEQPQAATQEH